MCRRRLISHGLSRLRIGQLNVLVIIVRTGDVPELNNHRGVVLPAEAIAVLAAALASEQ